MTSVLAIFDKMLATDETQTMQRKMLLMKLGYALDKHAYAEEHVVYPALREANDTADAEELETEHGQVKEFLYRLHHMELDDPAGSTRCASSEPRSRLMPGWRRIRSSRACAAKSTTSSTPVSPRRSTRPSFMMSLADQREPRGLLRAELDRPLAQHPGEAGGEVGIEIEVAAEDQRRLASPR